jgi:hypothetical protein
LLSELPEFGSGLSVPISFLRFFSGLALITQLHCVM